MKEYVLFITTLLSGYAFGQYEPTWDSLDARPLPQWYDEAKIGIFLHWGVYAVPSYGGEWFWKQWKENDSGILNFMARNYKPGFTYQEFAPDFTAKFYNPDEWATLFKNAGAKYVVLTSKHHEGYTLWPSTYSYSWNSVDVGPHRDLLGDLTDAVRNQNLQMGYYYSLLEWYNPRYMADQESNWSITSFSDNKVHPEIRELVTKYKPDIVWSDGEWEAPYTYWKSTEFLAWLYNESPVKDEVVVNDRWGSGDIICHHGDFYTCSDRYNPGVLQTHKWENAMTIDKRSWGYRERAKLEDYMTTHELIETVVITVSCGGNILINVGPTKEGLIMPVFQERLLDLGKWLNISGEAIYSTTPWTVQNDTQGDVWYTSKNEVVYAIVLEWPSDNVVRLESAGDAFISNKTNVQLLGYGKLQWLTSNNIIYIVLPDRVKVDVDWAWVLKIEPENEKSL